MSKITRDAFLYLEPSGGGKDFAQCGTCLFWIAGKDRCLLMGESDTVVAGGSCGFYAPGEPEREAEPLGVLTPAEAGYVERPVRCENCAAYKPGEKRCDAYTMLNKQFPEVFDLDDKVEAQACCNAQHPKAQTEKHLAGYHVRALRHKYRAGG